MESETKKRVIKLLQTDEEVDIDAILEEFGEAIPFRRYDLKSIDEAPYNPGILPGPEDQEYHEILESLDRWGLVDPLVINTYNGRLIAGHKRRHVMLAEGIESGWCREVSIADEDSERALNLALNHVRGRDDPDRLQSALDHLEQNAPDVYDLTGLAKVRRELPKLQRKQLPSTVSKDLPSEGPPEMKLLPFEHHDYILLAFTDKRDFAAAVTHFGLQKQSAPKYLGKKAVGLGRVVDGGEYLKRIRTELSAAKPAKKATKKRSKKGA